MDFNQTSSSQSTGFPTGWLCLKNLSSVLSCDILITCHSTGANGFLSYCFYKLLRNFLTATTDNLTEKYVQNINLQQITGQGLVNNTKTEE